MRQDEKGALPDRVEARIRTSPGIVDKKDVDFIDVAPNQAFSVATSMVPFLEHNDANRALMGSNMQKQAVPLIRPEAPLVATGMEELAAPYSGRIIMAEEPGVVMAVDATKITIKSDKTGKDRIYSLVNFQRTNAFNAFHQRPTVSLGQKIKKGDLLADTSTTDNGQIALGQNMRVAFMSWNGSNYEDAIILSERLLRIQSLLLFILQNLLQLFVIQNLVQKSLLAIFQTLVKQNSKTLMKTVSFVSVQKYEKEISLLVKLHQRVKQNLLQKKDFSDQSLVKKLGM
jgi:DNA-directed RNA polymerase beta subunit